ncbi:nicotinate-nucleotide adenylyltransferase [Cellvibrio mixtus]|uniref:nicotinate-nucleotide adenylyltransferase n=1 Tax=Cellvibrio mixtus TaxID=39650 RepID=UPI000587EADA|nr:nicotinate-nucleotide adenylyltransferase [Cellvibrio mixtus]
MRKCIGFFGGTFDPIHLGHLRLALELKQQLALDEMRLLPCYIPPHRASPSVDAQQRLTMLQLALNDCAELRWDARELQREKPSYTYDTLSELRAEFGEDASLSWCMGMDSFVTLDSWHRWQELAGLAHLVVVARPGWEIPVVGPVAQLIAQHRADVSEIHAKPAGKLVILEQRLLPISATEIRVQIQAGESPQFLIPDAVWKYIRVQGLYR